MSDIEGKVARVVTRKRGQHRVSNPQLKKDFVDLPLSAHPCYPRNPWLKILPRI